MSRDRIKASLYGAAFGDAMGAPTEFIANAGLIAKRFPPRGPTEPPGHPARVTDDTQMMLAVGKAIGRTRRGEPFDEALRTTFVTWLNDPDNDRAPGNTCLRACAGLERGLPWPEATVHGSKGCGANMRVQPVGLLDPSFSDEDVQGIAQLQAAMTHGHPTALAASDATAMVLRWLLAGMDPRDLPAALLDYASEQRTTYHQAWLGELWERTPERSGEDFIARGWDECMGVFRALADALDDPRPHEDPCLRTGDAWIAEEALATGLHALLLYVDDPVRALNRAVVTRGDSDSIACLTGAFAGAAYGTQCWPEEWYERIEYAMDLDVVTDILAV